MGEILSITIIIFWCIFWTLFKMLCINFYWWFFFRKNNMIFKTVHTQSVSFNPFFMHWKIIQRKKIYSLLMLTLFNQWNPFLKKCCCGSLNSIINSILCICILWPKFGLSHLFSIIYEILNSKNRSLKNKICWRRENMF